MGRSTIAKVWVEKLDLDAECRHDLATGKGIRLTSEKAFDKKNEKVYEGLQSPFFGSDFSDEDSYNQRYRCKCGALIGKVYEGSICPKCGTRVEYVEVELDRFGWIILDHFRTISPIYVEKLNEALGTVDGEKVLSRILQVGFHNERLIQMPEREQELLKKHPYIGKGCTWLADNIDEVLTYYEAKKPNKAKLFNELKSDSDKIFTHCIPVFSAVLRPETPGEKDRKLYKLRVNKFFQALIKSANAINALGDPEEMLEMDYMTADRHLFQMNKDIMELYTEIFNILNGKKGVILSRVVSGRHNFSTRCIISASSGDLRADEIEIGYISFLELFRYEITNEIQKVYGCDLIKANEIWKNARNHFNSIVYRIMTTLCERDKQYINVTVNRNPCNSQFTYICDLKNSIGVA